MAESERKNLSYIGQSAVLVLLALLMMGIHHLAVAHFHVQPGEESLKSVVAHVPREFSIALLIAAILNCVVERNTQRRHERLERAVQSRLAKNADLVNMNVRKNVLRAVFKQNLGKHVIAQIEAKLFQPTPYRVESDVSYNLSIREQPDRTKFVVIDSHIRYVVFNPSRQPVTVPLYFCTTSPDEFHEYTEIRDIKCDGVSVLNRAILPSCKRGGTIEYNEGAGCPVPPREHRVIEIFTRVPTILKAMRAMWALCLAKNFA